MLEWSAFSFNKKNKHIFVVFHVFFLCFCLSFSCFLSSPKNWCLFSVNCWLRTKIQRLEDRWQSCACSPGLPYLMINVFWPWQFVCFFLISFLLAVSSYFWFPGVTLRNFLFIPAPHGVLFAKIFLGMLKVIFDFEPYQKILKVLLGVMYYFFLGFLSKSNLVKLGSGHRRALLSHPLQAPKQTQVAFDETAEDQPLFLGLLVAIYMALGQNPVPPVTLKSLLKRW